MPGLGKDLGWQEGGVGSEAVNKGFEPSRKDHCEILKLVNKRLY